MSRVDVAPGRAGGADRRVGRHRQPHAPDAADAAAAPGDTILVRPGADGIARFRHLPLGRPLRFTASLGEGEAALLAQLGEPGRTTRTDTDGRFRLFLPEDVDTVVLHRVEPEQGVGRFEGDVRPLGTSAVLALSDRGGARVLDVGDIADLIDVRLVDERGGWEGVAIADGRGLVAFDPDAVGPVLVPRRVTFSLLLRSADDPQRAVVVPEGAALRVEIEPALRTALSSWREVAGLDGALAGRIEGASGFFVYRAPGSYVARAVLTRGGRDATVDSEELVLDAVDRRVTVLVPGDALR